MDLTVFFKAVIDADRAPVVICNTDHQIVYMNPAALNRYASSDDRTIVGNSIFACHSERSIVLIKQFLQWFMENPDNNVIYEGPGTTENKDVYMVALRDESGNVIGYYEKHEYREREQSRKFQPA